ncbi:MAG: DUF6496 domain-containing protein [Polyangiaceae bacterium]|jgi:hypothetical protein
MPEKAVKKRSERAKAEGKAPSTQAGEFVREEIHHVREGKHGARSPKQAIAIGLSKARRAGVDLPPPKVGAASDETRKKAERDTERGHGVPARRTSSAKRARSSRDALKREGKEAGSHDALSKQARSAATRRRASKRPAAARKKRGATPRHRTAPKGRAPKSTDARRRKGEEERRTSTVPITGRRIRTVGRDSSGG